MGEEEEERGREREEGKGGRSGRKEEGGGVQVQAPGGLLGLEAASRRWPCGVQESSTHVLAWLEEEDKSHFAKMPLGFGGFLGNFKTALVCIIW
jgi:hypothetical protein